MTKDSEFLGCFLDLTDELIKRFDYNTYETKILPLLKKLHKAHYDDLQNLL